MNFPVRAITLDLDDTLWPFAPIGERIDNVLHDWLQQHSPRTAELFPIAAMHRLRAQVFEHNPHLAYDLGAIRRLTLQQALAASGADTALVEPAYEVFYAERNRVECYPDALGALARIAARVPVAALTNGNADLQRIGLERHFVFQLGAREHGAAKPEASIFHAACARLQLPPSQVLHVGDHIEMDVVGAMQAGLRGCWINRERQHWTHPQLQPDLHFDTLAGLADWLDAQAGDTPSTAGA
ncbi:HAD-IA family hydrolase [Stenotrophomonas sp. MMGLT7]|uniref:HAD family hydrolase n=1 Tax=Stenotrophomonas sp. MMGLT7 TaxID=2901227 RepID=UPI001E42D3C2|nr:HAD-IA family hydrolase [Stenotrophomonas sp. MMGLT7]